MFHVQNLVNNYNNKIKKKLILCRENIFRSYSKNYIFYDIKNYHIWHFIVFFCFFFLIVIDATLIIYYILFNGLMQPKVIVLKLKLGNLVFIQSLLKKGRDLSDFLPLFRYFSLTCSMFLKLKVQKAPFCITLF